MIEHDAFRDLWSAELDGGLVVEREDADKIEPGAVTIFADEAKLRYDIVDPAADAGARALRHATRAADPAGHPRPEKQLAVPDVAPDEYIKYRGIHLIDKGVIEEYEFLVPYAEDPSGVITWYTQAASRRRAGVERLSGAFATLAPMVRDYLGERAFERPVELDDKVILRRLAENDAQQLVVGAFQTAIRALSINEREPTIEETALRVSDTPPFPWSRETVDGKRTVFNLTPVDSSLEAPLREVPRSRRRRHRVGEAHDEQPLRARVHLLDRSASLLLPRLRRPPDRRLVPRGRDQGAGRTSRSPTRTTARGAGARTPTRLSGRDWAYEKVRQKLFDAFTGDTVEGLRRFIAPGESGSWVASEGARIVPSGLYGNIGTDSWLAQRHQRPQDRSTSSPGRRSRRGAGADRLAERGARRPARVPRVCDGSECVP